MDISYVICPNGYGHFRRSSIVLEQLSRYFDNIKVYTSKSALASFYRDTSRLIPCDVIDTDWLPNSTVYKEKKCSLSHFYEFSYKLKDSFIVSDNYPEVFQVASRGILIANFFWHREFQIKNSQYSQIERRLNSEKIPVLTHSMFGKRYVREFSTHRELGFFGEEKSQSASGKTLLFVKGLGAWSDSFDQQIIRLIEKFAENTEYVLRVDKSIPFDYLRYDNVKVLDFNETPIEEALAVIGRPSVGIVSDTLLARVPFFPIEDSGDLEAMDNAKRLTAWIPALSQCEVNTDFLKVRQEFSDISIRCRSEVGILNFIRENTID